MVTFVHLLGCQLTLTIPLGGPIVPIYVCFRPHQASQLVRCLILVVSTIFGCFNFMKNVRERLILTWIGKPISADIADICRYVPICADMCRYVPICADICRYLADISQDSPVPFAGGGLIVDDEKGSTIRDGLVQLCVPLRPLDGPPAVIRVDPGPGFNSLRNDTLLASHRLRVEVGEAKNKNKNPVAEKAVQEFEDELLRHDSERTSVTPTQLVVVIAALNARIRNQGLSSREIWTQRDQFSHDQLPLDDEIYIDQQYKNRQRDHRFQPKVFKRDNDVVVGDLVYLYSDKDKTHSRPRYLVVSIEGQWCFLRKFIGTQLRHNAYKVHRDDVFKVSGPDRSSRSESRIDKSARSAPSTQSFTPTTITNDFVQAPLQQPTALEAPSIPVEITEPETEGDDPHIGLPVEAEAPPSSPPLVAEPTRTSARSRRPPSYLADFELS
jgi:hypothetical protein